MRWEGALVFFLILEHRASAASHTHMPCWHSVRPMLEEGGVVGALVSCGTINGYMVGEAP